MKISKTFKEVFKGILLFIFLWIVNTGIAFSPPIKDSTNIILTAWFVVDISFILTLRLTKKINNTAILTFFGMFIVLIGFYFIPMDNNIPESAISLNRDLSQINPDKYVYAEELFDEIDNKYEIKVRRYLIFPHRVFFVKSFISLWGLEEGSYVDSDKQAQIFYKLLLESEKFDKSELRLERLHFCTNSFHTILVIIKDGENIYSDFFATDFLDGVFGDYADFPCGKLV